MLGGAGGDIGENELVPHAGMLLDRLKSRHNVISRKDNLILTPASKPVSKQNSVIQENEAGILLWINMDENMCKVL